MNKYETLFLLKPDLQEDQVQAVLDRLQSRIQGAEGKLSVIEHWGNRSLAYPVQYRGERLHRGYYVLLTYGGDGKTVDEVERNIKILDPTFRYLTVKLEDGIDPASLGEEVQVTRREHGGRRHGLAAREGEEAAPPPPEATETAPSSEGDHVPAAQEQAPEAAAPAGDEAAESKDDAGSEQSGDKEE